MAKYVALLRGIGPGNPDMSNEKLRGVFEKLGFKNVQSVISSGNVVFESKSKDTATMEAKLEAAWPKILGFNSTTLVRSQEQLQQLADADPFKGLAHGPKTYLLVTFFKKPTSVKFTLPYTPKGKPYTLMAEVDNTLFTAGDNTALPTTDLMSWLEKQFGKEISSRTWLTIHRILKKMSSPE